MELIITLVTGSILLAIAVPSFLALHIARNMHTYTGAGAPDNVDLTLPAHTFSESNPLLTGAMLGDAGMSDSHRTALLQRARGVDLFDSDGDGSTTDARRRMGDPLHGNPVAVSYGGTAAAPDTTLYLATNEGLLHAIDSSDGHELFSFIPRELLPLQDVLFGNSGAAGHPYGLDGPLTVWANDFNGNGVLQDGSGRTEAGEHAYIMPAHTAVAATTVRWMSRTAMRRY